MYMSPVGIMNAGDPEQAYREAIDIAGAHQTSYGREAAGVMAAVIAEALSNDATVDSVIDVARLFAKDGTKLALEAVLEAASRYSRWEDAIYGLRTAMEPYDTVKDYADRKKPGKGNANLPSRMHSIEELPIALAMLVIARGETMETIYGGVHYGRDADSIASMGGAIAGALNGVESLPVELRRQLDEVNQRSYEQIAQRAYHTQQRIWQQDRSRFERRIARLE
jgi:ADP-ribosylglycohydrolase